MATPVTLCGIKPGHVLLVLAALIFTHMVLHTLSTYPVKTYLTGADPTSPQNLNRKDVLQRLEYLESLLKKPQPNVPQPNVPQLNVPQPQARRQMNVTLLAMPQRNVPGNSWSQQNVPQQLALPPKVPLEPAVVPKPTPRPRSCSNCFNRPYSFIINSPEVCAGTNSSLKLLILITSTHAQKQFRNGIRLTWGSLTKGNKHPLVRYAFLLGSKSREEDAMLALERAQRRDIIAQNFTDSYKNLTLKTLMAFEWADKFCPSAQYIMKTDHDVYTHVENMLRLLDDPNNRNHLTGSVLGACSLVAGPIRNSRSKYFASKMAYPEKSYPGFCSGTGYVLSNQVAKDIVKISPSVPFFFLEDVYVALCVQKLGYRLKGWPGFYSWEQHPRLPARGCGKYGSRQTYTIHRIMPPLVHDIWAKCPQQIPDT